MTGKLRHTELRYLAIERQPHPIANCEDGSRTPGSEDAF
jgi:hypothetical protein